MRPASQSGHFKLSLLARILPIHSEVHRCPTNCVLRTGCLRRTKLHLPSHLLGCCRAAQKTESTRALKTWWQEWARVGYSGLQLRRSRQLFSLLRSPNVSVSLKKGLLVQAFYNQISQNLATSFHLLLAH